jgi:hypothetical protein
MSGGGDKGEVPAVGPRKQAAAAHGGGGSSSQRPKTTNANGGVRRQLATQVPDSVSVIPKPVTDVVMITE